jgi:molybdopterin-biosynthesis enzyme MoeA-like protein
LIGGLGNVLVGGDPILSKTINLMTYESEIASSLTDVQDNDKDVEIGSYPFFRQGKLGVSIVLRSKDQDKINLCNSLILEFVKAKNIEYGFHKEAFAILEKYYEPGNFNDGRQKMAKMPVSANLILNPSSGAPGFYVENVFSLPGVPSILKAMIGGLNNVLVGGDPILSKTINFRTYESEIASSLTDVQDNNKDVEIGSYPFFHAGKLGVSIVLRSENQSRIDACNLQILEFVNKKNIEVVDR